MDHSNGLQSVDDFTKKLRGEPQTVTGTCDSHGDWSMNTYTKYPDHLKTCPTCRQEASDEKDRKEAEAKAKAAAERRHKGLIQSGVSVRHMERTFDSFVADTAEQVAARDRCKSLVDGILKNPERQPSLILCGKPGTGKTHLSCAMIVALFDGGKNVCRISAADMVREFKDSWRKDSEFDETRLLNYYGGLDLFILEEIGVQYGSDTERMFIFEVVNRRYENCLPTVLVSNLDPDKLRDEVGERVMDRLREDGGKMIKFTGESWRKQ